DVVTPGNHDFDWGVPTFRRAVGDAAFPYVSANLYAASGDTLLFPAYRVLRRQGVRVGVTGITTPGVMLWDRDQLRGQVRVARVQETAGRALEALRREADLAVAVIHSGMDGPASYDTTGIGDENVAAGLAALPVRPDVVIVGHTHREMRDSVLNGVHFVQPRPYGVSVSVVHVHLLRSEGRWRVARVRADLVATKDVAPSPLLTERLAARHDAVKAWMDQPVGEALAPMRATAARAQATAVTDFVLEAQRRRTGAELSSGPAFNLSAGFDSGTIRRSDVLGLYPYENTLRAVRVTGARLKAYLEWSARYFRVDAAGRVSINDSVPGYDFDLVRGARYDIDLRQPVGERIRNLAVRGRPVQPADSFTLAINSYRQTGGGGYDMLRRAAVVYDKGERVSDILLEEVAARSPLDPRPIAPSEWRIVPAVAASAVRTIFGVPPEPEPRGARDTVLLRVIASSDLHGAMLPGAAALGTLMDSLGAECDCPTLRLDGGDAMQGDLLADATSGRAAVEVLNRLGFAAAALGDRDFDWPLDTLRRRMSESSYPWLAANLFDSATGRRPAWAVPYRVLQAAGMSVGVIGYVTPATKTTLPAERTRGLRFGEGELAIHDVLGEVGARRPAVTILLAHAGAFCDSVVCDGEAVRLTEQLGGSGVDLVLAGHEHRPVNTRVAGIPIVGAGGAGTLAVADLVKTPAGGREFRTRVERVDSGPVRPEPALAAALETYRRRSDTLERRVLGRMKRPLARTGDQFPLGGFLAQARRNLGRADVGLVRTEAIRADLPAGPVTFARLTEVEPFRSDLVRLTLTGTQLRAALEQALPGPGVPVAHIAGALVRYDPKAQAGHRIKNLVLHGGRQVRPRELYTLATDDSTAVGVGGFTALLGRPLEWRGMLEVEATAAFLRRLPQPVEVEPATGFLSTRR
ncbi:MAG: 5'-nucleotidase C-terminal domain-containing protein, partial [Gemmatimonadales bacterium]